MSSEYEKDDGLDTASSPATDLAERPGSDVVPTDAEQSGALGAERLWLSFHGRVIDHLGIQMYQSPVAAFAELVANAWDSYAEVVKITLPATLSGGGEKMVIEDDGHGMTFDECQKRYLNVGYNRRQESEADRSRDKKRIVLGRKGIGKFAGFGIAQVIVVDTVAKATGEKTVFASIWARSAASPTSPARSRSMSSSGSARTTIASRSTVRRSHWSS
jgi:hypothetical protein